MTTIDENGDDLADPAGDGPARGLQTGRTGTIVLAGVLFVLGPVIGIALVWWVFTIFR